MLKIPEVTRVSGTIYQGATGYWVVTLWEEKEQLNLTSLAGYTPRATLMKTNFEHVADCSCAYLDATVTLPQRTAIVLPIAESSLLHHGAQYLVNLDLEDGAGLAHRKLIIECTVEGGQTPVAA